MRTKFALLLSLLGVVAILSWAALPPAAPLLPAEKSVVVPPPEREPRPHISHAPPPAFMPIAGSPDEMFLYLDTDGDGLLSFDEMPYSLQDERHRWDVNGDGHIDLFEWNRYVAAVSAPPPPRPIRNPIIQQPIVAEEPQRPTRVPFQPQSPGNMSQPKQTSRPPFTEKPARTSNPAGHAKHPKNLPAWFKDYDTDGDGQVGLYEWQAKKDVPSEFEKYDLNHDGYITVEELVRSGQFLANTPPPQTIHGLGSEVGDYFYFELTGSTRGVVWGTKVYTGDSFLAAAAVHAGVLKVGETGFVKVTILAGQDKYEGTEQNGVSSQPFPMYPKSFSIESIK